METNNMSKQTKFNYITIFLLIAIALVIGYMLFNGLFKGKYTKIEEEMVTLAKDYVLKNNINTTREIYITTKKLNYNIDNDCLITSGVIFDGASYTPNLVCKNYHSDVLKNNSEIKDYITLNGDDVIVLAKGMNYYEPGYVSNDLVDIVGNVGTEEGVYNIYYKTKNSNHIAIRKVIIIDDATLNTLYPTLTLNGDEIIYLTIGSTYNEQGGIANDPVDGNITSNIKIEGSVNPNKLGNNYLVYSVTNSRGYKMIITRTVVVVPQNSDLMVDYTITPENLTSEEVTIKLNISGIFNKIIYPDGTEGDNLNYVVSDSGTYKFYIYDEYNRVIEKEIVISNIDKTIPKGTCNAIMYYGRTEISVDVTSTREISSYEYLVDTVSSGSTQTKTYTANVTKPTTVKVILTDSINNKTEIECTKEDKLNRKIVTNDKGKNCLEGMQCYIQFDYGSSKYPYCSMSNNPNSCGGIGRNGCSITSASNAIAAMGVKSSSGAIYNPFSVWDELYPVNKKTGQCNGGCSGWTRIRDSVVNAGLSAPLKVSSMNRNNLPMVIENLSKGYPVIIRAETGPFTKKGHYMTLLAIREDGFVFLSDSANEKGINKAVYKGKQYYVDTWIDPEDLITGKVKEFLLVGPPGLYQGK